MNTVTRPEMTITTAFFTMVFAIEDTVTDTRKANRGCLIRTATRPVVMSRCYLLCYEISIVIMSINIFKHNYPMEQLSVSSGKLRTYEK